MRAVRSPGNEPGGVVPLLFLINDDGNSAVTLDALVPEGWHTPTWGTLTAPEAQPLVAAEEAYWLRWVGPRF